MKLKNIIIFLALALFAVTACDDDDNPTFPEPPVYDMTGFAKGADVSWLTEMEKSGVKFYDASGREKECMSLLRDLGMNSIRLRVWVNPENGWCNADDVLVKAWRAHNLGMRIMIDFHYSDSWADPAQQTKPAEWANLSFEELKFMVEDHTFEVLYKLQDKGIDVEWVQIGNETGDGMLWEDGRASVNMENYAVLNNIGYNTVKKVYPNAKVIVHLQNGQDNSLFRWLFDGLKDNGGKWDVIGMSLYPSTDNWQTYVSDCNSNMTDMVARYGTEVMICEVGMSWDEADTAKQFLSEIIAKTKAIPNEKGLGVFYWEPQAYGGWNEYTLGAFDDSGKPTVALDAFAD